MWPTVTSPYAPPQFSQDGLWYWTGATWIPAEHAPATRPAPAPAPPRVVLAVEPEEELHADPDAEIVLTRRQRARDFRQSPHGRLVLGVLVVAAVMIAGALAATRTAGTDPDGPQERLVAWLDAAVAGDTHTACAFTFVGTGKDDPDAPLARCHRTAAAAGKTYAPLRAATARPRPPAPRGAQAVSAPQPLQVTDPEKYEVEIVSWGRSRVVLALAPRVTGVPTAEATLRRVDDTWLVHDLTIR